MTRRSELRKTRRHYAVLGYIAQHGPCSAAEIAAKLGYGVGGVAMDLAVMDVIWRQVASNRGNDSDPQQRLYRLPTTDRRPEES